MKTIKYSFILLLCTTFLFQNLVQGQNKNTVAGIAGGVVGATAIGLLASASVESVKEGMERNIVEWVYEKYNMESAMEFELKLIKWEASKREDLSNVSVVGYKLFDFKNPPTILLSACSPGWINEYGINFENVKIYEIDQKYWGEIMLTYLNLIKNSNTQKIIDIEKIPVQDKRGNDATVPLYFVKTITTTQMNFTNDKGEDFKFQFRTLGGGDIHVGKNFNDDFKIDYNEGNLNLFLRSTGDLVRIKRDFIVDITKNVFENKIPLTVYNP